MRNLQIHFVGENWNPRMHERINMHRYDTAGSISEAEAIPNWQPKRLSTEQGPPGNCSSCLFVKSPDAYMHTNTEGNKGPQVIIYFFPYLKSNCIHSDANMGGLKVDLGY